MSWLVPHEVNETQVTTWLDAHFQPGWTYLRGQHEDYNRVWFDEDRFIRLRAVAGFGATLVQFNAAHPALDELRERLGLLDLDAAIARAEVAFPANVRPVMQLAVMLATNEVSEAQAARAATVWRSLFDTHEAPAVATGLLAATLLATPEAVKDVVRALCEHERWGAEAQKTVDAWDDQPLTELPTTDVDRLHERAERALLDGDYRAALDASQTAVAQNEYVVKGHVLRARALDGLGDHWGAWFSMAWAHAVSHAEDKSDFEVFIDLHRTKAPGTPVSDEARQMALQMASSYMEEAPNLIAEVQPHDAPWKSRWRFVNWLKGEAELADVVVLEPESVVLACLYAKEVAASGDEDTAMQMWRRWIDRPDLDVDGFDSFALTKYQKFLYADPKVADGVFEQVTKHAAAKNWDAVEKWTDFWIEAEPQDVAAWTWRGIGRTFSGRSADAIEAYTQAISLHDVNTDDIYFGEPPVATAYFNRACELAHTGAISDALFDDLYGAVVLAPRYAESAASDDYLSVVVGDPRFAEAIQAALAEAASKDEGYGFDDEHDDCDC